MPRVAIGLGGNLGDAPAALAQAALALSCQPGLRHLAHSSLYRSKAIGPAGQPDYANAAALFDCQLGAQALLQLMQDLEADAGRVRSVRWGARTLDLDLLLYGDETIQTATLTVPHAELTLRSFVLRPLLDIMPQGQLPDGRRLDALLQALPADELIVWEHPAWQALDRELARADHAHPA